MTARPLLGVAVVSLVLLLATTAAAESPRKGTVDSSWASVGKDGKPQKRFSRASATIYASFVWKRAPTTGLPLSITFRRPDGTPVARWSSKSLKGDRVGTRLFTYIPKKVFKDWKGTWTAVLTVDSTPRGQVRFTVVN